MLLKEFILKRKSLSYFKILSKYLEQELSLVKLKFGKIREKLYLQFLTLNS